MRLVAYAIAVFVLCGCVLVYGVTPYEITDLGSFAGNRSTATAINSWGQVVGYSRVNSTYDHAFFYTDGELRNIHADGGLQSFAWGLNDDGHVVGSYQTSSGEMRGFLWTADRSTEDLGPLYARDINNLGQVTGFMTINGQYRAYVRSAEGILADISPAGSSHANPFAINNHGHVVGEAKFGMDEDGRAFLWEGSGEPIDLGSLWPGCGSRGFDINELGQVVGYAATYAYGSLTGRAFLASKGNPMQDLGSLGGRRSLAAGINNQGHVVGFSEDVIGSERAFLYTGSQMLDLNDLVLNGSAWELMRADGINDNGQIVGQGFHDGNLRAFLLTPIPEPGSLGLLIVAGLVLLVRRT